MVVNDFHRVGVASGKCETKTPLLNYTNRVLTVSIALPDFQSVTGWKFQIFNGNRCIKHFEFATGLQLNISEARYSLPVEESLGVGAVERLDHKTSISRYTLYAKRNTVHHRHRR